MKKFVEFIICLVIALIILFMLYSNREYLFNKAEEIVENTAAEFDTEAIIENTVIDLVNQEDLTEPTTENIEINLTDVNGKETEYTFTYNDETFYASYTKDNWHIKDSYKITSNNAIKKICEELIAIHPIHGKDMESYRTVDDLAYEWVQHNVAYQNLPEDSEWRSNVKDVDLDPKDQGLTLEEMYEARTGEKLDLEKLKEKTKSKLEN